MNCKELNIWIESASEDEFVHPPKEMEIHFEECEECRSKFHGLFRSFNYMNSQRLSELPDFTSRIIIDRLEKQDIISRNNQNPFWRMNRVAAAIIIVIGTLTGVVLGNAFNSSSKTADSTWSSEFSSLDNDQDYYTSLFD